MLLYHERPDRDLVLAVELSSPLGHRLYSYYANFGATCSTLENQVLFCEVGFHLLNEVNPSPDFLQCSYPYMDDGRRAHHNDPSIEKETHDFLLLL